MQCFYLKARFAAFRTFSGGSFRPTASFITHSAAYGLLLNIAGIEMRQEDNKLPMTIINKNMPHAKIALGALSFPVRQTIFQQLHNYPIGASGKQHVVATKGSKYNIAPVKRELLSDVKAYICIDGNDDLEKWILQGVIGERPRKYGLPFLGDNNFMIDRFESVSHLEPTYWYCKINANQNDAIENTTRLTITIDRAELSRTRSGLFAPLSSKKVDPPKDAWVKIFYD